MHLPNQQQTGTSALRSGCFTFQTLAQVERLARFTSAMFPEPDKAYYGLYELMVNAIEHGNLGITFEEKAELLRQGKWREEVEHRLMLPECKNRLATLRYEITPSEIAVTISDQGEGFDWRRYITQQPDAPLRTPNGRGIATARTYAFPNLKFLGTGNQVICSTAISTASHLPQ